MGGRLLEGPAMADRTLDWRDELGRWLKPFLARLGHKARSLHWSRRGHSRPALGEDRGSATDFLHNPVNQGEVVIHLRRTKTHRRDGLTAHRISAFDFRGS
jgi:hypothetical protein